MRYIESVARSQAQSFAVARSPQRRSSSSSSPSSCSHPQNCFWLLASSPASQPSPGTKEVSMRPTTTTLPVTEEPFPAIKNYFLGMIQKLRNAVVAPTGMGKNYGRIMPLLRQGSLVRQKIMHYGFFGQCFSGCLCSQEETSQLQPILLFWKIPLGTIIKLPIYPSAGS